jgi:uncharacterized protein YbjQ (UPF0145 family)
MSSTNCPNCGLVNFATAVTCKRCNNALASAGDPRVSRELHASHISERIERLTNDRSDSSESSGKHRRYPMRMQVTTTFTIDGHRIREYKGIVRGIIVRAPTIAQGFFGGLQNIIGGRIGAYTEMCEQARQQAYDSLIQHARDLGANAVVGLRYDASEVVSKGSATEVLCYGTAVVIEPES